MGAYRPSIILWCGVVVAGAAALVRAQASDQELDLIVNVLQVGAGSVVADVGAGSGEWTLMLAKRVGPGGTVYGSDVRPDLVDGLALQAARTGLKNIVPVLAAHDDPKLAERCCDAALVRLVYHALRQPERTRQGLQRALRPGGRVLVIDFRPPVPELIAQMEASGFTHVRTLDRWHGQRDLYGVLFLRSRDP